MAGSSFVNVCRYRPTAGGTTDWTFSAAMTGYQSPTAAGVVNGSLYSYRAESADLTQWEIGQGAYNTGTGVLARTTVYSNNLGTTALINFTVAPQVAIVALALDLVLTTGDNSFTGTQQAKAQINIGVTANPRNIVGRNGGLEVWQRGTSVAVAASSTLYTADGWYLQTLANEAFTVARVAGLTNNSRFAAKVQRNSAQTGTSQVPFACPLDADELIKIIGNFAVLSFTAKCGANYSPASSVLGVYVPTGTGASPAKRGGTGYTGEVAIINTSVVLSTTATRYNVITSSAGAANVLQMEVQFYMVPVGTAGADDSFTIDDIQLEVAPSTVTTGFVPVFERTDYIADLVRCRRHLFVGAAFVPATTAQNLRTLKMRAVPTITGGGAGINTTGTTADSLIGFQTAGAVQTLTLTSEI